MRARSGLGSALALAIAAGATGDMVPDARPPAIPWNAPPRRSSRSGPPGATKKRKVVTKSRRKMIQASRRANRR